LLQALARQRTRSELQVLQVKGVGPAPARRLREPAGSLVRGGAAMAAAVERWEPLDCHAMRPWRRAATATAADRGRTCRGLLL